MSRSGRPGFYPTWMCVSAVTAMICGLAAGLQTSPAATRETGTIVKIGVDPRTIVPLTRPELAPKTLTIAPKGGSIAASPVLNALRSNAVPLSQRQVFAVVNGETKHVDEQVARQLGGRIGLAAELPINAVQKALPAPTAITERFSQVREVVVLPTRYTAALANGSQAVSFNVALYVLSHLSYDVTTKGFFARIHAYLENPDSRNDRSELAQEVPVSLEAQGAANVMPLRFRQLGTPQEVRLDVPAPTEPYLVKAVTALDQNAQPITVDVLRPKIVLTAANNPIRGFGLETTQINIRLENTAPIDGDAIALQRSQGTIEPGSVPLKSGSGSANLRSSGLGTSTVTASHAGFADGTVAVEFVFPLLLTLSTLAGALIGVFVRRPTGPGWLRKVIIAIVAAFVVVIGSVVGIQIGDWSAPPGVTGEGLFFVLAVLAAVTGEAVFNRKAKDASN